MPNYRTNSASIVAPEDVAALLVRPAIEGSVVGQIATHVQTAAPSVRVPVVQRDPSAAFVAEGQEIPVSDMDLDEVVAIPAKLAGLTIASNELLEDSVDGAAA